MTFSSNYPFALHYNDKEWQLTPDVAWTPEIALYVDAYVKKLNRYRPIGVHNGLPVYSLYQPSPGSGAGHRALAHRLMRRFNGERLPSAATISITKACQCDCAHCSAVFYNHAAQKALSTDRLGEAIAQSVSLGVTTIILLGGEPLLQKDLATLIQSAPQSQAATILFTNGELLSRDRCLQLKDAGLMGVFVSIDSPDGNVHDTLRGRAGLFEKACVGMENAKKAGLLVGISSYLSPSRLQDGIFDQMMDLGKDLGVHELTFFDAIPTGRWLKADAELLSPSDRQKIQSLVRIYRQDATYPGLSVQSTLTSECGSAFCFAANTQFYLTAFGDMCPCDFTPLSIGKFPELSISELWEKMISTPPYNTRAKACRMQDPEFRKHYIDPIPSSGPFPYPL